jgi:hypothetical protein
MLEITRRNNQRFTIYRPQAQTAIFLHPGSRYLNLCDLLRQRYGRQALKCLPDHFRALSVSPGHSLKIERPDPIFLAQGVGIRTGGDQTR